MLQTRLVTLFLAQTGKAVLIFDQGDMYSHNTYNLNVMQRVNLVLNFQRLRKIGRKKEE